LASPRPGWISLIDSVRNILGPTNLDIRPNKLIIRTRIWSGDRPGIGTYTDSDLELPQKFKIKQLETHEIASSGGKFELGDIEVSHITPGEVVAGVGFSVDQLAPPVAASNIETLYIIQGPMAGIYSRVTLNNWKILSWSLVLRKRSGDYIRQQVIYARGNSSGTVNV
jgi:hypothetical protein